MVYSGEYLDGVRHFLFYRSEQIVSKDWVSICKDNGYELVEVLPTFIRYKHDGFIFKQVITDMNEIDEGVDW